MTRFIGGITIAILMVMQAGLAVKGGDIAGIRRSAAEAGKEFSEAALETFINYSGMGAEEAALKYRELAKNEIFLNVLDIPYRDLGGHAGFGAEMSEHMLWGGASVNRTRLTVKKLAVTYGKVLADIFKGGTVSAASLQFMMDLEQYLWPLDLNPREYSFVFKSARGQFGALYKVFHK